MRQVIVVSVYLCLQVNRAYIVSDIIIVSCLLNLIDCQLSLSVMIVSI